MSKFESKASSKDALQAYESVKIGDYKAPFELGPYNTHHIYSDPKRVGFLFARYKFVAKMLTGYSTALEVGCQEGLGTLVVAKAVPKVTATDFYLPHIENCRKRLADIVQNIEFRAHDIISGPLPGKVDAAYSLDVLEHIDPNQENLFMAHVCQSLSAHGVCIIGTPSLESQRYASEESRLGHINCKSGEDLRSLCLRFFHTVFMFGMNDEVIHTGFLPMSHYLFAVCVTPKQ